MPCPDQDFRRRAERAFQLAHFVCGERRAARAATVEALNRLTLAARTQAKRRYYRPGGLRPHRTKVALDEPQLLQRLVYVTTERQERAQEQIGSVHPDRMLVRFVKHLVRMTVKRNAFHVAVGMTRVLHTYSTPEALDLHAVVVGDPARTPDDDYCRARKRTLVRELRTRFGDRLATHRSAHGEVRFTSRDDQRARDVVRRALRRFTPWDTRCVVPEAFDPLADELTALRFAGRDPDREHPVEVRRMHALLHPACFRALTASLDAGSPEQRLAPPRFADLEDHDMPPEDGPAPPLDDDEVASIEALLHEQATRRLQPNVTASIVVDGQVRARLPEGGEAIRLPLAEGSELVDIVGRDRKGRETLLASHLLQPLEGTGREKVALRLPTGTGLTLDVQYRGAEDATLEVRRTSSDPRVHFARALRRWRRGLARPAAAAMAVAVLAVGVGGPLLWRATAGNPVIAEAPPPPPAMRPSTRAGRPSEAHATHTALTGVRSLWIPPFPHRDRALRNALIATLAARGDRLIVDQPEQAEAALRPIEEANRTWLAVVTADGRVLWRAPWPRSGDDRGARRVAEQVLGDLPRYRHSP